MLSFQFCFSFTKLVLDCKQNFWILTISVGFHTEFTGTFSAKYAQKSKERSNKRHEKENNQPHEMKREWQKSERDRESVCKRKLYFISVKMLCANWCRKQIFAFFLLFFSSILLHVYPLFCNSTLAVIQNTRVHNCVYGVQLPYSACMHNEFLGLGVIHMMVLD